MPKITKTDIRKALLGGQIDPKDRLYNNIVQVSSPEYCLQRAIEYVSETLATGDWGLIKRAQAFLAIAEVKHGGATRTQNPDGDNKVS